MVSSPRRARISELETDELVDILREHMRGLTVCLSYSWGGLEQVVANDAMNLATLGLNTSVLVLEGSPIHERLAHRKELKVIPLNYRPRDFIDFDLRKDLQRLLGEGANLIHAHQPSLLGSIIPWTYRRKNLSLVASRHILSGHSKNTPYHAFLYRRLDAFVVMSEALKENVMMTHPLREKQIRIINLGLDFEIFDPSRVNPKRQRAEWGADDETVVVGMVGRIDPAKGQDTLIKAAAGLTRTLRENEKVKFVIVGEETLGTTSTYLEELQQMATQFRIADRVVFAGYQENIPEIMRAFDIFVMPSHQETFGLVAIEALAMECPIIISGGGSAREIIGNEEYGLLVRSKDAFDLQRQIRYFLAHPMDRVLMGQAGRQYVRQKYDRQVRIRKTLELYERLLRRRGN